MLRAYGFARFLVAQMRPSGGKARQVPSSSPTGMNMGLNSLAVASRGFVVVAMAAVFALPTASAFAQANSNGASLKQAKPVPLKEQASQQGTHSCWRVRCTAGK